MSFTIFINLLRLFCLTIQPKIFGLTVLAIIILFVGNGRAASPGALDLSFGMRGTSAFRLGSNFQQSRAVVIQPDGKVVLAGFVVTCVVATCSSDFLVVRFNPDGTLDNNFGTNGSVVTDYFGQNESAFAAAIQTDGKIVIAGGLYDVTTGPHVTGFKLVRYLPDGMLDPSFGTGGKVYESFDDLGGTPQTMIIQPDGKIVVAGSDNNSVLFVARFNPNGSLDTSFGTNGRIVSNAYNASFTQLVRQPDGKIIIAATSLPFEASTLRLIRLNANGTHDSNFGNAGVVTSTFAGSFKPTLALQPDGKIIVSGYYRNSDIRIPPLRRFNADGSVDGSFAPFHGETTGTICISCTQMPTKILLMPDGRFYLVGLYIGSQREIAVSRYLNSGTIDNSFGFSGLRLIKRTNSNSPLDNQISWVDDAALQADGKVVITATNNNSNQFFAIRINSVVTPLSVRGDFDGDRKTDFAVFRPSSRFWYVLNSSDGSFSAQRYAADGDVLVPGDYNYDAKTDLAVYRPSDNGWYISPSLPSGGGNGGGIFGQIGDIRVPEDYDGDGYTDLAVFRPSDGTWTIRHSGQPSRYPYAPIDITVHFGLNGDKPVPADYDGDGRADIAVFRPSSGFWHILRSSEGLMRSIHFGLGTDKTVQGDYDGDLKTDIAVFRDGNWYVLRSSDNVFVGINWGLSTDKPVPGDYDGDGKFDFAAFRPSTGVWYALKSTDSTFSSFIVQSWGISEDTPIPFTFVR